MRLTNGPTLTYKFNKNIFGEIEAIQDALMIRTMVSVPDRATISKIRKLSIQARRIKKSVYYNPNLTKLDYTELLDLLHQKINTLERGKAISRGMAIAKSQRLNKQLTTN